MTTSTAALWRPLYSVGLFVRFPLLWFTLLVPLLGAAMVEPRLAGDQVAWLLGVGLCFHLFAYVFNDVIDLPVDRTAPARLDYPLVRGTIGRGTALAIALAMVPLAFAITLAAGAGAASASFLAAAFALMTVYDLWGKRLRLPPLTDLAQGIGWGALSLYGTSFVGGEITPLAISLAAFFALYVYMINGVQASLRDLVNDRACGMRTTAILLGVRPSGAALLLPLRFRLYALLLQTTLTALLLAPLLANDFGYSTMEWLIAALGFGALNGWSWLCLARANAPVIGWERVHHLCLAQLGAWQVAQFGLFAPGLRGALLVAVLGAYLGMFLSSGWLYGQVRQRAARLLA